MANNSLDERKQAKAFKFLRWRDVAFDLIRPHPIATSPIYQFVWDAFLITREQKKLLCRQNENSFAKKTREKIKQNFNFPLSISKMRFRFLFGYGMAMIHICPVLSSFFFAF